jgi:hypothetical protein
MGVALQGVLTTRAGSVVTREGAKMRMDTWEVNNSVESCLPV